MLYLSTPSGRVIALEGDTGREEWTFRPPPRDGKREARGPHRGVSYWESADGSDRRILTMSPDGRLKAYYKDRNVWISGADERDARAITTDGSASGRIKYGSASWVYGEELSQRTAMWWSPDSRKVAYYRFDERSVRDYFVVLNQTQIRTCSSMTCPAVSRSASTSAAARRSRTKRPATTCTGCRGHPTDASCSFSA